MIVEGPDGAVKTIYSDTYLFGSYTTLNNN